MSFWLRLCLGLILLVPALAHAQSSLDIPSNGDQLSGIGLISGWKCEADGEITITFYTEDSDGNLTARSPIATTYGASRSDTSAACDNDDGNNGFYALWNWAILGDGEHTAVASDNGVEFDRNTFTVTTAGTEYLVGAQAQVTVPNFPNSGEATILEWNQSTQHFEMVMRTPAIDLGSCVEELIVHPGEMCSGSISVAGSNFNFTFTVDADGQACISGGTPVDGCYPLSLPSILEEIDVSVTRNNDGSWTIHSLPVPESVESVVDLGTCEVDMIVQPGAMCSGSILGIDFTFSVDAEGQACIDGTDILDGCFDTDDALNAAISIVGAAATKNTDNSWTITDLP